MLIIKIACPPKYVYSTIRNPSVPNTGQTEDGIKLTLINEICAIISRKFCFFNFEKILIGSLTKLIYETPSLSIRFFHQCHNYTTSTSSNN